MRAKFVLPLLVALGAYVAYPYYVTFQIISAFGNLDKPALEKMIDWESVRHSMEDDLNLSVSSNVAKSLSAKDSNGFAAIGAAIASSVAPQFINGMVEAAVTPPGILNLMDAEGGTSNERISKMKSKLTYAFFDGPKSFRVEFANSDGTRSDYITWRMNLTGPFWQVKKIEVANGLFNMKSEGDSGKK